jgi:peptidyl-prolyl cis-trans isomerase B (cyclophilin B)
VILVVVIIIVGFLMSGCSSSDSKNASGTTTSTSTSASTTIPLKATDCPPAGGATTPLTTFATPPRHCITNGKHYSATFDTTEGTFSADLDTTRTPNTANNFAVLAGYGYYNNTNLFRTESGTGIIQGGSPHTQDGTDPGPGYLIDDEGLPFTSNDYGPGTLAMARTSAPNSASAQFFLLANDGGRYLGDPNQLGSSAGSYVVFGKVTSGLDVLKKIAALDNGQSKPSRTVTIRSIKITGP